MAALLDTPPAAPARSFTPSLSGRLRGFASGAVEIDDAPVRVAGRLPDWLRGRLLLNGPALWELPQGRYQHWFDGLAMLHRLHIGADGVRYRSRYFRSQSQATALAAGRPVIGEFDTPGTAGFFARLRGAPVTDNPAVVMSQLGSTWFAVTETPTLMAFDPDTLATHGPLPLADDAHLHLMAAHGCSDAAGNYWNVGTTLGPQCELKLFRLRPGSTRREVVGRIKLPKSGYLHGFAMTPSHAIVWDTAMRAQALAFRFGARAYIRNFRWSPESGSALYAIALADGSVRRWALPAMMCFHAVQAWDEPDGSLGLELSVYPDASIFEDLRLDALRQGRGQQALPMLTRYRLRDGRADAEAESLGIALELPQVNPARWGRARAGIAWGASLDTADPRGFLDRTLRVDLASRDVKPWRRGGAVQLEPLCVANPAGSAEDDAVLLVPTLADGDAGTVIGVLDARTMECLAELHTPQVVPFGFHAAWAG